MGEPHAVDGRAPIHAFFSSDAWIEGAATRQLETLADLPGVSAVAAMPDLHPGKYGPVGCCVLAGAIHPALVGGDVGCGMDFFALDLAARKLRVDKAAERLRAIDAPFDGDGAGEIAAAGLAPSAYDAALGTIGGGNHFCEIQAIDAIFDAEAAKAAGLDRDRAFLLVHSGSRGLGHAILEPRVAEGLRPLDPDGAQGRAYLAEHDHALRWAGLNRRLIARRAAAALRCDARPVCGCCHNFVERRADGMLHRKGAAAAAGGLVPVPGSRGALTYLVAPAADMPQEALASLAHGAGRKYDRASMAGRVGRSKSERERLTRNPFGGRVICEDRALLVEEAPEAYKPIERVAADLARFGLAKIVATLKPLVTLKRAAREAGR